MFAEFKKPTVSEDRRPGSRGAVCRRAHDRLQRLRVTDEKQSKRAYEAAYAMTYDDGDGNSLDGNRRYRLRFAPTPPVGAFWSVTMYDLPEFYLVANPIDRYSIGDRTPGLHYDPDGTLTLVLQHDAPESAEDRANWLPTPPDRSGRSCACTNQMTRSSTAATSCHPSAAPADLPAWHRRNSPYPRSAFSCALVLMMLYG